MTIANPIPQTSDPRNPHVADLIEAYLAGGLTADERTTLESHVAGCAACAEALEQARRADLALVELFAATRPDEGFEDQLIGQVRLAPPPRWGSRWRPDPANRMALHPAVRRVASGVAAAVVLAAIGYAANSALRQQSLPFMRNGPQLADLRSDILSGKRSGAGRALAAGYPPPTGTVVLLSDSTKSMSSPEGLSRNMYYALAPAREDKRAAEQWSAKAEDPASGLMAMRNAPAHEPDNSYHKKGSESPRVVTKEQTLIPEVQLAEPSAPAPSVVSAPTALPAISGPQPAQGVPANAGRGYGGGSGGRADPGTTATGLGDVTKTTVTNGSLSITYGNTPETLNSSKPQELALHGVNSFRGGVDHAKDSAVPAADGSALSGTAPGKAESLPGGAPGGGGATDLAAKASPEEFGRSFKPGEEFAKLKVAKDAKEVEVEGIVSRKPGAKTLEDDGRAKETPQLAREWDEKKAELPKPADLNGAIAAKDGEKPQSTGVAPPPPPAVEPVQTTPPPPPPPPPAAAQRKIIRNGEMTFEVDSFDSSMILVTKIAGEESGFVATTDSEKLANGKVKGTVIVRCPPELLDTLVLKLRALGELKSQKIAAQDVTKLYTDLESQLRAAHAMEARLMQIIKDGKGLIKDLLEAEKQHGVWVEKIEALQGEINYYNNLVSLSTLTITLVERDIKTPYATAQTERVSMGLETEDVEKSRGDAIKEIEQAKGRIIESELNKHEAGQFSATIVADVPPDAADPLIDRLKTVGRVARLERERRQTSEGGTGAPPPGVRLERKDTRIQLSINNLANVAPRTTTTLRLAADDVEKAYKAIVDQVKAGGGRVVASQLNRPKAEQVTGTITFDVPSEKADVLSAAIRSGVEVMRLDVIENKDTLDVTDAKRGFSLEIFSLASVAARETTTLTVASRDVPAAFNKLLEAARTAGGRVSTSQLNEQNAVNMTGSLEFNVPRENLAKVEAALKEAGLTTTRNVTRSPDSESTVDSKVRLVVTLIDEINLTARQTVAQTVAARNVPEVFNKLADAVRDAGARIATSQLTEQDKPTVNGQLYFSVERTDIPRVESAIRDAGETVGRSVSRSPDLQNTVDTKVSYQVTVKDQRALDARETIAERVAVHDVPGRYERVLQALRGMDAQVITSQLNEQNRNEVSAVLEFTVRRDGAGTGPGAKDAREQATVEKALSDSADVFGRSVSRSQDSNALDSKVHYSVTLIDADTQKPRETFTMAAEVSNVDTALADLEAAAVAAGGRAVDSTPVTSKSEKGETLGKIVLDVPLSRAGEIVNAVRDKGRVTMTQRSRDDQVPEGSLSRARIDVTVGTGAIMAGEGSLWDSIKSGLRTSGTGLLWTLQLIIVGLCLIGPWAALLWLAWRLIRRARRRPDSVVNAGTPPGPQGPVAAPT